MTSKQLFENSFLKAILDKFDRAPFQKNRVFESDCELIDIGDNKILALTYDAIVEEITSGLYSDFYQIGWMSVTVSMSDLAAVGSNSLGLLLDLRIPKNFKTNYLIELQRGVNDACKHYNCFIFGGDTNTHKDLQVGTTGVGLCGSKIITRIGCKPEDSLYTSGKMGHGIAYAYSKYFSKNTIQFLPNARTCEGQLLRDYASSCIDTSDGFFPALCQLMELNKVGFQLGIPINEFLHSSCIKIMKKHDVPNWFFLAGPHGEFELLFTIPEKNIQLFENSASMINWQPLKIGDVTRKECELLDAENQTINCFQISNLYTENNFKNPKDYFNALISIHNINSYENLK